MVTKEKKSEKIVVRLVKGNVARGGAGPITEEEIKKLEEAGLVETTNG